ncbi:MAG: diaminopimelate decarboxylase [Planctomycetota bacterium]|nr:diaminopimelate decarboxylase [Planctomycetota bacterium]
MLEADTKKKLASRLSTFADGRHPSPANPPDCCPIIAGSDVLQLVARYGSPLIVMVEATLRKKYRSAYAALSARYPRVKFAWSYKTNYLRAICNIFHDEGALAEVVSDFEYDKARSLGISGKDIILNGPGKDEPLLRRAIHDGSRIQIDHQDELILLERITADRDERLGVGIRINMSAGSEQGWNKFGFNHESGEAHRVIERIARSTSLRLDGLHMHLGTSIMNLETYRKGVKKLAGLARHAHERFGITLNYLNAGGGFAAGNPPETSSCIEKKHTPSFDEYAEAICDSLRDHLPHSPELPLLLFENGRSLVDEAGYMLTRVLSSKETAGENQTVIVDAGVNLLHHEHLNHIRILPTESPRNPRIKTKVCGPLCMNTDVLKDQVDLPPLKRDDLLVLHPIGAYHISQSMQFISYRPPIVLLGRDGEQDIIRERETLKSIEALEHLPDRMASS